MLSKGRVARRVKSEMQTRSSLGVWRTDGVLESSAVSKAKKGVFYPASKGNISCSLARLLGVYSCSNMSPLSSLPNFVSENYEVREWKHASAILQTDFPEEYADILDVLTGFRLPKSHLVVGGGGKSKVSQALERPLLARGWKEKSWSTKIVVDNVSKDSPTHKVDCFKNRVALEIEWSNKDPFYDRDLNNFRLLFDLRVISVGIIITKADELRSVLTELGIWSKSGTSTTWMSKLLPRIEGGGGGGCPILAFGIKRNLYLPEG